MGRLRGLLLVLILAVFIVISTTVVHALGNYTIKVGEDTTFTNCNYNETFFLPGNNTDNVPMPLSKEATVTGNTATLGVTSPPGYEATAIARTGIAFGWDTNGLSWDAIKDTPVRVTFDITYTISTYYGQDGSCNAGIYAFGFQSPQSSVVPGDDCIDWMGNDSIPPNSGIIDSGSRTQHVVMSFTNK